MPGNQRPARPSPSLLEQAVINGDAYRVSGRQTLDDAQEFIIHIDPVDSAGTVYLEPPRINPEETADYDVFENADPGTGNFAGDLQVHNMRYDGNETPSATVDRVTTGNLTTTNADQTEETFVDINNSDIATAGAGLRGIYRIVPTTDVISLVITDRSGGTSNQYSVDIVLYEGPTLPN